MVFDRYYAHIHGFAGQRLGQSLADDVAAETFLIAVDQRERYDLSRQDARPWLFGIASNLIARHQRGIRHVDRQEGDDRRPLGAPRGRVRRPSRATALKILNAVASLLRG